MSSPQPHSLETLTYQNQQERAQRALKQLGLDETKLLFKSKADYLCSHPNLLQASPSVQDSQYARHEARRLEKIAKVKELRNELLNKASTNTTKDLYNSSTNLTSQIMQKEMEKIEQMKLHQIGEIKSIIDYEVYVQELRKRNDNRMRHLQEKEEAIRMKFLREQGEREKKIVLEDIEREKQSVREERELFKLKVQKEEEERQRREEEAKRRERIEREALSKLLERRRLHGESQRKIEEISFKSKSEQDQRLKELEEKEEYRLKFIEKKKQEAITKAIKIEQHAVETYNTASLIKEEDRNTKQQKIEGKQVSIRESLKKYSEELEKRTKEQQEKQIIKAKAIIENSQNSSEKMQKRFEEYQQKKAVLHKSIEEKEKKSNWELFQKLRQRESKDANWKERKLRNDSIFELKRSKITLRQSQSEEKVKLYKEKEKQVIYDKFAELKMKKEVNNENLRQYEKIIQFYNWEKMERFQMKLKKIREKECERKEITVQKKSMEEEILRRKEMMLKRINRIVNSNDYNSQDEVYQKVLSKEQFSVSSKFNPSTSRYATRTRFASPSNSRIDSSLQKDRKEGNEANQSNSTIRLEFNGNNVSSDFIITQDPRSRPYYRKVNFISAQTATLDKIID